MLQIVEEVVGRLGSNWPDLFVATGIAGYKEDRNATELKGTCVSTHYYWPGGPRQTG